MISVGDGALLVGAGIVGGIVGTAGGITSLITYPALLAVGVAALPANIANLVALVVYGPGAAVSSRPELTGEWPWVARWSLVTTAGAAGGAVLLLVTPGRAFEHVIPFLVALGSLVLLLQPRLSRLTGNRLHGNRGFLAGSLLAVSTYNGYFGAGAGVMTLAVMLLVVDDHVARANALKNMLVGAAGIASAAVLAVAGPVQWGAVVPLGAGIFVGGTIGPHVARRLPGGLLRWLVALVGVGLAVKLWVSPG